ncbi:hypothetical protein [Mycobacterium shigaense]|uniref:hypothetical protein n=1 Tax=Mycobacterium shigaense TaxID=722731 RepID=UPI002AE01090|nr:hypothetical protein [Mycobacterium shigaense]MEA1121957.1 hypothetical protein [Mycobacterium shigaense]
MPDTRPHPYLPNATEQAVAGMLDDIGVAQLDDLFTDVPSRLRHGAHSDCRPRCAQKLS